MNITSSELAELLSKKMSPPINQRDFISFLENNNTISLVSSSRPGYCLEESSFYITVSEKMFNEKILEYVQSKEVELVVTSPSKNLPPGWLRTNNLIKKCFNEISPIEKITIIMPFVDPEQTANFFGEIKLALTKGVQIEMITLPPNKVFDNKKEKQKTGIDTLKKLGVKIILPDSFWFHAKVICFGKNSAYVGSANWTPGGFKKNFEIGVFLRGTKARSLITFLKSMF